MGRFRQFLLLSWAFCALPVAASAQWASSITEHDWCFTVGGNSYGLQQRVTYTISLGYGGTRTTTLYLGRYTATTRIPAPFVALIALLPVGTVGFFLLTRLSRGNEAL